jgi:hypothetical protein
MMYDKLKEHKKKYGHCNVSKAKDIVLYSWVCTERKEYRKYLKSNDPSEAARFALLNQLELVWNPREKA